MASASDRRYQSRLFNFIHQQICRVSEQSSQAFRHLQVSTSWGVQVLLYPIYLLFQSTKLAGKQLHSRVQQSWPQLDTNDPNSQPQTSPTADTPIKRVLLLVDVLSVSEERVANLPTAKTPPFFLSAFSATRRFKFHSTPTHNRPVVRGIATQLLSRILVLVTAQNETLDILTLQQQQQIQEQIEREVANYWHHRIPQTEQEIRGNFSHQTLAFLDRTVAELESNRLAPVSEVAIALVRGSWRLVLAVQARLTVSLSGKAQLDGIRQPGSVPAPAENHKFRIQALIWAAIDYFFGNRGGNLISDDLDSWLTSSDLFGISEPENVLAPKSQVQQQEHNRTVDRTRKKPRSLKSSESLQISSQDTQLEPAPEWIETQAAAMGYVKHPLEQLLELLDRAMLWLEEVLMIAWQWVRSLPQSFN